MPKPWSEVAASQEFQALPPAQQEAARQQYFAQVVAPQLNSGAEIAQARAQFDQQTKGGSGKPRGILAGARDFGDALQHHAMSPLHGAAQLVEHGVNAAANLLPEGNPIRGAVNRTVASDDAALAAREQAYQARTPDGAAAYGGAAVGEIAPWAAGIRALKVAGALPTVTATGLAGIAQKGGLLAGEGAAMGAAQPVTDGPYGAQKARQVATYAALAPATAGAVKAVGAGAGAVRNGARYLTDSGRERVAANRLAKLYGDSPEVLAALRQDSGVAGFNLTPAQALATPEAVQAERVLRNNGVTAPAFAQQEAQNNAALRGRVAGLAGDDAALEAAVKARREGPGNFWRDNLALGAEDRRYGNAQKHIADFLQSRPLAMPEYKVLDEARKIAGQVERGSIDPVAGDKAIRALQPKTMAGRKALDQALGIIDGGMVNPNRIATELERLSRSGNKAVSAAAADHLRTIAKNQDGMGWVHARVLDDIRQNIGSMLGQHSPNGAVGSAEGALYGPLKAKITNQIDRAVPGYRDNLAAYARASQPINDMEAARTLLGAIDSAGRDAAGGQTVNLAKVRQLLARDDKARFPMSPQARQQLEAVMEALQKRSVTSNTIAATGPGTAADSLRGLQSSPYLMRLLGYAASGGGMYAGGLPGLMLGVGATEGATAANNAVLRKVGMKAADARLTADAIEAARNGTPRQQSQLLQLLMPYETRALPRP